MITRKPNKYAEIFRLLEGDADHRVKLMLTRYGKDWDLPLDLIESLLQDLNSTAEDVIDTLKVFAADYASSPELRQAIGAMDSGTQKMRRESLVATADSDHKPQHNKSDRPKKPKHHRHTV
jgi:hypothetical protein